MSVIDRTINLALACAHGTAGHPGRARQRDTNADRPARFPAQALRVAALRPARRLVRRTPHQAQERRRQDQRQRMCSAVPVPPRRLHPPLRLADHRAPRRQHRSPLPARRHPAQPRAAVRESGLTPPQVLPDLPEERRAAVVLTHPPSARKMPPRGCCGWRCASQPSMTPCSTRSSTARSTTTQIPEGTRAVLLGLRR